MILPIYTYFNKGCFGNHALVFESYCLMVTQAKHFIVVFCVDQNPKTTFIEIGVYIFGRVGYNRSSERESSSTLVEDIRQFNQPEKKLSCIKFNKERWLKLRVHSIRKSGFSFWNRFSTTHEIQEQIFTPKTPSLDFLYFRFLGNPEEDLKKQCRSVIGKKRPLITRTILQIPLRTNL